MRRARNVLVVGVVAVALNACGGSSPAAEDVASSATGNTAVASPSPTMSATSGPADTSVAVTDVPSSDPVPDTTMTTAVVPAILDFSLPLVGSEQVGSGQVDVGGRYAGSPVAFWFWAPT